MTNRFQNYATDVEFLKTWFIELGTPEWNLYRGFHSKVPERDVIFKQRESNVSLEDSFVKLQDMIEFNSVGGGRFTIYVPAYQGNKAATLHFAYNLSDFQQPAAQYPMMTGLGGYGIPGFAGVASVQEAIAKEREKWEMEQRIADLEAAQNQRSSISDVLLGKLAEIDPDTAMATLGGFLGGLFKKPVQLHGVAEDFGSPAVANQDTNSFGDGANQAGWQYSEELLLPWLDSIRQHFPDDQAFWVFMNAVSTKFNENPPMYKTLLGS